MLERQTIDTSGNRLGNPTCAASTHAETLARLAQKKVKPEIAQMVSDLRHATSLTQAEFARFVCLEEGVIKSLEESTYAGDAFLMLARIVKFLGKELEIRIVPLNEEPKASEL